MKIAKKINNDLNKGQLSKLLKISDPFLMINKLTNIVAGKTGCGIKNMHLNDWFYKCHFINEPVMPGTLQVEAMLQTIVALIYLGQKNKFSINLITKTSVNFHSKITGEGMLKINAEILQNKNGIVETKAIAFFKNKKVSSGQFRFINSEELKI